ncbi:MAG: sigma-70 family RNA polymerase sigma factor [Cyclobacteriaceae bacterium]|nr:sigma-70 family RNA polymerase sigma factor [Cyclobacteriaceae bacterium HetDA_MAG_MS6]
MMESITISTSNTHRPILGSDNDERDVWNQFREGSDQAFNYIYDNYYAVLCKSALRFSPDKSLIEDCVQDLFITIHRNRKNLGKTTSIRAYLSLSVKRKLARYLKKENKFETITETSEEEDLEKELPFEFTMIEEQQRKETINKLETAMGKLPERQRKAIEYFYYENCSYAQLADRMEMSNIKSARNLVYKGVNSLKTYLN